MNYTEILIAMRKISRAIHLDSKRLQKESGLSLPQLLSISYIAEKENFQCSQLELRNYLQLNSSTVSGIVQRLSDKGLVARVQAKEDKRAVSVHLTALGLKQVESAPDLLLDKLNKKLDALTEKDLKAIKKGLRKLDELLNDVALEE